MAKDTRRKVLRAFIVLAVACPLLLCGILFGLYRSWFGAPAENLGHQLESAKKEGVPLEPDDLRPKTPLPAEQNAATVYNAFLPSIQRAFHNEKQLSTACDDLLKDNATAEQQSLVETALQKCREPLVEIVAASKRPACDFHYKYEQGASLTLPELSQARYACKLLIAQAHLRAKAGKIKEAYDLLTAVERVGRHMGNGPMLISMLVQCLIDNSVMKEFANLLQLSSRSRELLQRAQTTLDGFGPVADLRHAFSGEVVLGRVSIRIVKTFDDLRQLAGSATGDFQPAQGGSPKLPDAVRRSFEDKFIQRWREVFAQMPADGTDWETIYRALTKVDAEVESDRSISNTMTAILFPTLAQSALAVGHQVANRRVISTSLRLLQQRLRTGHLPPTLPNFGAVSTDPFDGKPLKYSLEDTGFKIYSIDRDREDNGGIPPSGSKHGDLVRVFR